MLVEGLFSEYFAAAPTLKSQWYVQFDLIMAFFPS